MNTEVLLKVRERGYWRILMRPTAYLPDLFPSLRELEEAVRSCIVRIRGWDYPHWEEPARLNDSICASVDWNHHKEYWRLYKSGQFIHYFAMREDWLREDTGVRSDDVEPSSILGYETTVYTILEIFLFAGRWAAKAGLGPRVRLELNLYGPAGRRLYASDFDKMQFRDRIAEAANFNHADEYDPQVLIAQPPDNARPVLRRLFELFHWDAPDELLQDAVHKAAAHRL